MAGPMTEAQRYQTVDLPFYRDRVAPILPARVLDFHAHLWRPDHWLQPRPPADDAGPMNGARYMVTERDYGIERLRSDAQRMFPDRPYHAVAFGQPCPVADTELTNSYVAQHCRPPEVFPLRVTGRGGTAPDVLRREMVEGGFFGYKVFIPWLGNGYADVMPQDMIGPEEMRIADELKLVVLLHVPGAGRLADPRVQEGVRRLSLESPEAGIVLAHCGRCYHPDEMRRAAEAVRDLDNVRLDTAMVMAPEVLQMLMETIDSSRLLYATDFPVAAMRGRRVYVMDHWVDVVLEGYPPSAFRVASNDIRATFMAWEIALAVHRAGEAAGLAEGKVRDIFYENGMAVLRRVMDGGKLAN